MKPSNVYYHSSRVKKKKEHARSLMRMENKFSTSFADGG